METLVKCLGREKAITLTRDFNLIVDKYRQIADGMGYHGELRFEKKGGFIEIFVELENK
jgi:hypothetical protein